MTLSRFSFTRCLIIMLTALPALKAGAQAHCINRQPVPDLVTLGIFAEVDEIKTEYYTARCSNGKWIADSLLYTRIARFNSDGFYTQVTEQHPDFRILGWKYTYQDGQLIAITADRNGYKTNMQTIRWIDDNYYITYLFPFDPPQNMFRVKPESSTGRRLNAAGREVYTFLAAADTCDKWSETSYEYMQDTVKMYTFQFDSNQQVYHTALVLDKDDCGNPLQLIRDKETVPVMEFYRYRYFHQ